jgi:hypothetical protein
MKIISRFILTEHEKRVPVFYKWLPKVSIGNTFAGPDSGPPPLRSTALTVICAALS